jgi:hypothetical protein
MQRNTHAAKHACETRSETAGRNHRRAGIPSIEPAGPFAIHGEAVRLAGGEDFGEL